METSFAPCADHRSLLSADMPFDRALDIATECDECYVGPIA